MAITPGAPGPSTPLSAPVLTIESGDDQNVITWPNVSGATTYNLYWDTSPGVTKADDTKISGVSSPYVHSGLSNDTTYYYIGTTEDEVTESDSSSEASGTPGTVSELLMSQILV